MVWSKSLQLPGQADGWCSGSPTGAGALTHTSSYILSLNITVFNTEPMPFTGYVIKSGSVLQSYGNGQSSAVSCYSLTLMHACMLHATPTSLCSILVHSPLTSFAKNNAKSIRTASKSSHAHHFILFYYSPFLHPCVVLHSYAHVFVETFDHHAIAHEKPPPPSPPEPPLPPPSPLPVRHLPPSPFLPCLVSNLFSLTYFH